MSEPKASLSNYLLIIVAIILVLSIVLLYKYEEIKELSIIFVLLVISSVILLKYYD